MGKSWKKTGIAANNAKKGAAFTKVAREIQVAAKLGGPDPAANSRLRMAIDAAKAVSCPKDTVERAIKKGAGLLDDGAVIEECAYEGYGPHQVGVIVSCQTDNRNRTAADIRMIFNKNEGTLGQEGSVQWMFERVSIVEGVFGKGALEDPEAEAIEAGANEVESTEDDNGTEGLFAFYGAPADLKAIESGLTSRGWKIQKAELGFKAKNKTDLTAEQKKDVIEFLQALDDNDDTHRIYTTMIL